MTRRDIDIMRQAVEAAPNSWRYDGQDADAWLERGQDAQDETQKNEAYLIAGTLQLMNEVERQTTIERTPAHEARLTVGKPSQANLDTAARVLYWLADHAQLFPEEHATLGDPTATEAADKLCWAASVCHADADHLVTTTAELLGRDAENRRAHEDVR